MCCQHDTTKNNVMGNPMKTKKSSRLTTIHTLRMRRSVTPPCAVSAIFSTVSMFKPKSA